MGFGWAGALSLIIVANLAASQGLISAIASDSAARAAAWFAFGAAVLGCEKGGWFALRHYAVRFLLAWRGLVPIAFAELLDEAVDRLFLIRSGGSYEFIHLTFRDYMAEAYGPNAQGFPEVNCETRGPGRFSAPPILCRDSTYSATVV
jgi:hypothetical protein